MKRVVNSLLGKAKIRVSFKLGFIAFLAFLALFMTGSAFGEDIKTINIVTPSWEGDTNKDGTGFLFDIVRRVYKPAGIKKKKKIVPWARAEKMIQQKKADEMLCARKKKDRLTPKYPMLVEHACTVFKKENIKKWEGLKTLKGKSIIWLRGYDFHTDPRIKDVKIKKWDEIDDYKEGWGLISKGRADFFIDVLVDMEPYIKNNKVNMKPYQLEIIWSNNVYMSFAKTEKTKKLIEIYDKQIMKLFKSGELKKLYEKWDAKFSPEGWQ